MVKCQKRERSQKIASQLEEISSYAREGMVAQCRPNESGGAGMREY